MVPLSLIGSIVTVDTILIMSTHSASRAFVARTLLLLAIATSILVGCPGCSLGPKSLLHTRIRYNEAVKTTSEQQLLLNIVRLRYTDAPSSLGITAIADQNELTTGLQAMPFFASAGAGDIGTYRSSVLPQLGLTGASRPTLSYTPLDDEEFTRRLFTPISLDGVAYLSKTTWPISTVFRLYLENLNWVSNAETASGPTPEFPPQYVEFLDGVTALQNLQDRNLATLYTEDRTEVLRDGLASDTLTGADTIECIRNDIDMSKDGQQVSLTRKKRQQVLRVGNIEPDDIDWIRFTQAFRLDPNLRTYDLTLEELDPYLKGTPPTGLTSLDMETRSLLQVLFFLAHGVEVPAEHIEQRMAPMTCDYNGQPFDWNQVLNDLFHVRSVRSLKRPAHAHIAVRYKDYWFYIDERDRVSKSTFAILLEISRLELASPEKQKPILTIPLGR